MRPSEPHHLLRYLDSRPDDAPALQALGRWYRRRGRVAEAQDAWERSLKADPCDMFTHLYLGNLFHEDEDLDAALERFVYAATLDPEDPAPLWCQAHVYEAQGRQELAEEYHRRAVETNTDDEQAVLQAVRLREEWRERRRRQSE